jgi:thiosulfate/3-mercaptopyruvate sulfurtransferase
MDNTIYNLPVIVEPQQLKPYLGHEKLLIIDLSSSENYQQGHIPAAINVSPRDLIAGKAPVTGLLPDEERLQQLFNSLGLQEKMHVVVYDDEAGTWAGRFIWTLEMIGHFHYSYSNGFSYLNGGLAAWLSAGYEAETTTNVAKPSQAVIDLKNSPAADRDYIVAHLDDPRTVIWDARSPTEYSGEEKKAEKAGHIPGAINYEWTRAIDENKRIRDLDEIREELYDLDISGNKEIITHCQTHHRSGLTYLVGKALEFPHMKAYPGSWAEWGNDPETPAEK